jgi:hypothetical protein
MLYKKYSYFQCSSYVVIVGTYFHNYYVIIFLITGKFPNCKPRSFACNKTEQCISNAYVCDGRVHCAVNESYAEDEDFDLCQSKKKVFAEGASISCDEEYRPASAPIRINATFCDSHIECIDNKDEPYHCLPNSGKLQNKYVQYIFPTILKEWLDLIHILCRIDFLTPLTTPFLLEDSLLIQVNNWQIPHTSHGHSSVTT